MELTAGMPKALYQILFRNSFLNTQEVSRTALFFILFVFNYYNLRLAQ